MSKVFLVYEDYADLMSVEATLKRVGFDVLGITSEYSMADQMIGFNPDIVVGAGSAGKVTALGVGKRLREMTRWQGKSVLIFPPHFKPAPADLIKIRVDMILESPVTPVRLMQVIARLLGQDEAVLLERLNKTMADSASKSGQGATGAASPHTDEEAIYVKGAAGEDQDEDSSVSSENERQKNGFRFGSRMNAVELEAEAKASTSDESFPDVDLKALERELTGGGVPESDQVEVAEEPAQELAQAGKETSGPEADATAGTSIAEDLKSSEDLNQSEPSAEKQAGERASSDEIGSEEAEYSEEQLRRELAGELDGDQASDQAEVAPYQPALVGEEALRAAEAGLIEKMSRYRDMTKNVKLGPKSTITRVEARKRQRDLVSGWDKDEIEDLDRKRRDFTKALFKK